MSENTANSIAVKVSRETYDSLNDEQNRLRKLTGAKPKLADMLDAAWRAHLTRLDIQELPPDAVELPSRKLVNVSTRTIDTIPSEVLTLLNRHYGDPGFRDCIAAIIDIWSIGDEGVQDALSRNCVQFRRLAMAIKEREGIARVGQITGEHPRTRTRRALDRAEENHSHKSGPARTTGGSE